MRPKVFVFLLAAVASCAFAAAPASKPAAPKADPRVELAKKLPNNVKPEELTATQIPGIFELRRGTDIGYVSSDGRFYFSGELHDLKTGANVTEARLGDVRSRLLASVPEKEMMTFGADNLQYTVTVFTDIDCGYCRKLHRDIDELNKLGIRVRYMFFPRSGPGTDSWKAAESVWCAPDHNEALTKAKRSEQFATKKSCGSTPIQRQYELGEQLGVRGTPAIFTAQGDLIAGYMPPARLLAQLKTLEQQRKAGT